MFSIVPFRKKKKSFITNKPKKSNPNNAVVPEEIILPPSSKDSSNRLQKLSEMVYFIVTHFYFRLVIAWIVWLSSGTIMYALRNDLGWPIGFYMAVNVGYSIGWGWPLEIDDHVIWYSIFHLLVGASAVAASLGYFAKNMISSSREWYQKALNEQKIKEAKSSWERWILWIKININSFKIIGVWMLWIMMMTSWSCRYVGWTFAQGLYFSLSSLSTGGLWAIPSDSPGSYFFIVGAFAATGVPLMALATSNIAQLLMKFDDPHDSLTRLKTRVTEKELEMMKKFEIEDGDGEITRSEFILLCSVRLGIMNSDIIKAINDRYFELDVDEKGFLTYDDILEISKKPSSAEVSPMPIDHEDDVGSLSPNGLASLATSLDSSLNNNKTAATSTATIPVQSLHNSTPTTAFSSTCSTDIEVGGEVEDIQSSNRNATFVNSSNSNIDSQKSNNSHPLQRQTSMSSNNNRRKSRFYRPSQINHTQQQSPSQQHQQQASTTTTTPVSSPIINKQLLLERNDDDLFDENEGEEEEEDEEEEQSDVHSNKELSSLGKENAISLPANV